MGEERLDANTSVESEARVVRSRVALRRSAGVVAREMGDRAVLIQLATNRIFELNASGLQIWSMLEHDIDRDEICARLQHELALPASDVEEAVDALLEQLHREQLING
jgi:hypothetical protein